MRARLWLLVSALLVGLATEVPADYREENRQRFAFGPAPEVVDVPERTVRLLGGLSQDPDVYARARAAFDIGRCGGPAAVAELARFGSDPDPLVRQTVAEALGKLRPSARQGAALLLAMLEAPEEDVQIAAVRALGLIGLAEAADPIAAKLAAGPQLQRFSLLALGRIGTRHHVEAIRSRAAETAAPLPVRQAALRALADLAARGVVKELAGLEELFDDPRPTIRVESLRVGAAIGQPSLVDGVRGRLDDASSAVRREALVALSRCAGAPSCGTLAKMLADPVATVREGAARELGRYPQSAVGIRGLAGRLDDDHQYAREAAVAALVSIGKPSCPEVAKRLKGGTTMSKANASRVLGELRSNEGLADHAALLADPAVLVRRRAAVALGRIGGDGIGPRLLDALKIYLPLMEKQLSSSDDPPGPDGDPAFGNALIVGLGWLKYRPSVPHLAPFIPRKGMWPGWFVEHRHNAAWALGKIGVSVYAHKDGETTATVRLVPAMQSRIADWDGIGAEGQILRFECVKALGRMGATDAADFLQQHRRENSDHALGSICVWALRRLGVKQPFPTTQPIRIVPRTIIAVD